jgi:hypothetical protein
MIDYARDKLWPLVAATVVVDSLAGIWWVMGQPERSTNRYSIAVLTALTLGQVGVVAIWLAFRQVHDAWSYIVPVAALGIAAAIRLKLSTFDGFSVMDYACRTAVQMLGTLFGLWLVQNTIWRWLSVGPASGKWEFSMRQMLIWTTVTACFFGLVGRSTWSDGQLIPFTAWSGIFAPPVTAIGVVVVVRHVTRWYLRLCGYIAVGAIVATFVAYGRNFILIQLNVEFILEALIIAAWAEWSGILPRQSTSTIAA